MEEEAKYRVLFEGKIDTGADLDEVKNKMALLFKKADPSRVEGLFRNGPHVMVKDTDLETCIKYKKAFASIGAVCVIQVKRYVDFDRQEPEPDQPKEETRDQGPPEEQAAATSAVVPEPSPESRVSPERDTPEAVPEIQADQDHTAGVGEKTTESKDPYEEAALSREDSEESAESDLEGRTGETIRGKKRWLVAAASVAVAFALIAAGVVLYDVHANFLGSRERAAELKERMVRLREGLLEDGGGALDFYHLDGINSFRDSFFLELGIVPPDDIVSSAFNVCRAVKKGETEEAAIEKELAVLFLGNGQAGEDGDRKSLHEEREASARFLHDAQKYLGQNTCPVGMAGREGAAKGKFQSDVKYRIRKLE